MQQQNHEKVKTPLTHTGQELKLGFTEKPVFPFSGLTLVARFFKGLELSKHLYEIVPNKPTSEKAYNPGELLMGFVASVFCGMQRLSHYFRNLPKEVVAQVMESEGAAAHFVTIGRVFRRVRSAADLAWFHDGIWDIVRNLIGRVRLAPDWLVLDSTVLTRYGSQEKAEKGYNPKKHGRKSHHPLVGSLCEQGYILDVMNRPGKAVATTGAVDFLRGLLERAQQCLAPVLGVLADSGFYDATFLVALEAAGMPYIVVARFFQNLKRKVLDLPEEAWREVSDGISVAEFRFKQVGWDHERRYVVIRRDVEKCPDAVGKQLARHEQLELPGVEPDKDYRYSCMVTSLVDDMLTVWRQYRRRALVERQIEDLTYDFGFKKLNTKRWLQTTAMLSMLMLAFDLYLVFAHTSLPKKDAEKKLSTIRAELFMVGGVIGRKGREPILRLSIPNRSFRQRLEYIFLQITQAVRLLAFECLTIDPRESTMACLIPADLPEGGWCLV